MRKAHNSTLTIPHSHFTTMEFVVLVPTSAFFQSAPEAEALMLAVHKSGSAVVGIYSYDATISTLTKDPMMTCSIRS